MCGIAGKFNFASMQPVDHDLLARLGRSIAHRGPDDDGTFSDDKVGLGFAHRRLSIIDLAMGHQPMTNESRDAWIVFNGEIYNFPELRENLMSRGHQFMTHSDTEVILGMYREFGAPGIAMLNGIFAFAIYDSLSRTVTLARDQFGVKPLYYRLESGVLHFASEIKAILEDQSVPREINFEALNSFLTFRYNPSPQTLFRGIHKLPPGYLLRVGVDEQQEMRKYWVYAPKTNLSIAEPEAVEEYRRLAEQAVRRQMLSDVPLGLLLSGGIDSAMIGRIMQQSSDQTIKTFSIGFEGTGEYNELGDAKKTAELVGSDHHEIVITRKQYLETFLRSFRHVEEPIAETTIPALYHVCRLAGEHVKVVLTGQGADEPLAGYARYRGERYIGQWGPLLRHLPLKNLAALLSRNERTKRTAYAMQFTREQDRFLGIYTIFSPEMKSWLVNADTRPLLYDVNMAIIERLYLDTLGLHDALSRLLYMDTRLSLSDDLLLFGDKVSMAHSLEMRVPFLDLDLVTFLETLPSRMKLRGRTGKYIHKKAINKWLPKEIIARKKRGFATPMDQWLQTDLSDFAMKCLTSPNSACRQYFDVLAIRRMVEAHRSRKENYQRHIFALLSFELWHQTVFEQRDVDVYEKCLV